MKKLMAAVCCSIWSVLCATAGEWTLSAGVLTSADGEWELTGSTISGTTLTVGAVQSAAADGVLDMREIVVNGTAVKSLKLTKAAWINAPIREFYCDCLSEFEQNIFKGNTTLEKIYVSGYTSSRVSVTAFQGCTSLTSVKFDNCQPTVFRANCFDGCTALEGDIADIISTETTSIEAAAFYGCSKLKGKLVLNALTNPKSSSLCGLGIEELVITSPNITQIVTACFHGNTSLTNLVIKCPNLTNLSSSTNPFKDCSKLERIELDLPSLVSINTSTSYAHVFDNCSAIKSVIIRNSPWKNAEGADITASFLNKHVLYDIQAVPETTDAPKKCTIYAIRSQYKPYAAALSGEHEKKYKPKRCYGVYNVSSRKAYMAQPPDYRSGFYISL